MSMYATIQGTITYPNQVDYDKALKALIDGKWANSRNMLDELEEPISEETCDFDPINRTIYIPLFHYRNLGGMIDLLFIGGGGKVVWTSTDGIFQGGVFIDGKETTYDLRKWVISVGEDESEIPDPATEFQEYCEWQQEVESDFFCEFY